MSRQVLVVDDDASVAAVLAGLLKLRGYAVAKAGTAQEARQQASTGRYDVALVDVGLADCCGMALAEELEGEHGLRDRVILMTGGHAPRAYRCVLKPFDYKQLLSLIGEVVGQCEAARPPLAESAEPAA